MTEPTYGSGNEPLTEFERSRLRTSVDVAALERVLQAQNGQGRRAILAHFFNEMTDEDVRAIDLELGMTWGGEQLDQAHAEEHTRSTWGYMIQMEIQSDDPVTKALIDAVEQDKVYRPREFLR